MLLNSYIMTWGCIYEWTVKGVAVPLSTSTATSAPILFSLLSLSVPPFRPTANGIYEGPCEVLCHGRRGVFLPLSKTIQNYTCPSKALVKLTTNNFCILSRRVAISFSQKPLEPRVSWLRFGSPLSSDVSWKPPPRSHNVKKTLYFSEV